MPEDTNETIIRIDHKVKKVQKDVRWKSSPEIEADWQKLLERIKSVQLDMIKHMVLYGRPDMGVKWDSLSKKRAKARSRGKPWDAPS